VHKLLNAHILKVSTRNGGPRMLPHIQLGLGLKLIIAFMRWALCRNQEKPNPNLFLSCSYILHFTSCYFRILHFTGDRTTRPSHSCQLL